MTNNSGEDHATIDKPKAVVEESKMSITLGKNPHTALAKTAMDVEVIAELDSNGHVVYKLDIKDKKLADGDKIKLGTGTGPYQITFDLTDKTKLELRFDAGGPFFCIADYGSCPCGVHTEQIMVDRCDDDKLIVTDWNYGAKRDLRYQLNFVNNVGERMPPYDPIIINGGN